MCMGGGGLKRAGVPDDGSGRLRATGLTAHARRPRSDYLVSGDGHLFGIGDPDPPVLTPRQFLELIEASGA